MSSRKGAAGRTAVRHSLVEYGELWSEDGKFRTMPGLRMLATMFHGIPDMMNLNAGLPPASSFPFQSIQINMKDGSSAVIDDPAEVVAAQQYNLHLKGHPPLLSFVEEHTKRLHAPPTAAEHECIITAGNNPSIDIILRLFLDKGDPILVEEYTYPHLPESMLIPQGNPSIGLEIDEHGIVPSAMQETLLALQASKAKMPKLLYTVPVGQNPTGCVSTLERKEEIYAICRQFNIIILEDDPYYYLQYKAGEAPLGFKNLIPSYLSMDTDSRVIRFDSFSKVFAPGLRLGWMTAHRAVVNKFIFYFHGIHMGAATMSQVILGSTLQKMGQSGFETFIEGLQKQYSDRAAVILAAAEQNLSGLAEWAPVEAGMFLWVKLLGFEDTSQILEELQAAKVIVVPGHLANHKGPDTKQPCPYVRLSFVTAPVEVLNVAMEKLGQILQKYQGVKKPAKQQLPHSDVATNDAEVL